MAAVAGALWAARPVENAWLAAVHALLALLFLGFGAITMAVGNRVDAVGQGVAALGWIVLAVGAVREYPDFLFWGGLGLVFVGATVGLAADFGDDVRGALGG